MKQIIFLLVAVNIELFIEKELMGRKHGDSCLSRENGSLLMKPPEQSCIRCYIFYFLLYKMHVWSLISEQFKKRDLRRAIRENIWNEGIEVLHCSRYIGKHLVLSSGHK